MAADLLFAACVLPGCTNLVEVVGQPCADCVAAFGGMLRATGRERDAAQIAAEIAERDAYVREAYQQQRAIAATPERKAMQVCWLCTERRTCTKVDSRWECDGCRETP